jgi:6-phospho-beta-glucosidase
MKLTVVGGGSSYTPELADGLARRADRLGLEALSLMDVDGERLATVGGFVRRMVARLAPEVDVRLELDLDAALAGADFVVAQIRVGGQQARLRDETIPRRFELLGQETTGIGGFRKAMRTIPELLRIARAIEQHAPGAFLINFTNPVSIVTQAVLGHSPVRAIGLCNIPIGLRMDLAEILEVDPARIRLDSVGLNHLSFVRRVLVDGKDVLPELVERAAGSRAGRPANIPELDYPVEFIRALGMIPSDYLRYFYLQRETVAEQLSTDKTRAEEVMDIEQELLAHYADPSQDEKPDALSKRGGAFYSHAALEVIEAIRSDLRQELVVDVQNGGALAELADDAVVEVPCVVGRDGAKPLPQQPLEPAIRGLIQHVKSYEELTVQAAVERSRDAAMLALAAHPLVPSVAIATEIVADLAAELGLT